MVCILHRKWLRDVNVLPILPVTRIVFEAKMPREFLPLWPKTEKKRPSQVNKPLKPVNNSKTIISAGRRYSCSLLSSTHRALPRLSMIIVVHFSSSCRPPTLQLIFPTFTQAWLSRRVERCLAPRSYSPVILILIATPL